MNGKQIFAVLVVLMAPLTAAAQEGTVDSPLQTSGVSAVQAAATGEQNAGPMVIERVHSGVLLAPDFKVTEVDGRTSELVGGYGGWLTDRTLFIGGGGYWL